MRLSPYDTPPYWGNGQTMDLPKPGESKGTLGLVDGKKSYFFLCVAVHLGVKMADTLSFTAKVDMVDF